MPEPCGYRWRDSDENHECARNLSGLHLHRCACGATADGCFGKPIKPGVHEVQP